MTATAPLALGTQEGARLFASCLGQRAGLCLLQYFVSQDNSAFCGPATITMMLNALGVERPMLAHCPGHRLFTQDSLFLPAAEAVIDRQVVERIGMTLEQFARLIARDAAVHTRVHADQSEPSGFRRAVIAAFSDERPRYLAVNYNRPHVGQEGSGHFSPLGGYHEASDRVLILDVARFRYPPAWVALERVFEAMLAVDPVSGRARGYVEIAGH